MPEHRLRKTREAYRGGTTLVGVKAGKISAAEGIHPIGVALYPVDSCPDCGGRGEYFDAPGNALDGRAFLVRCPTCCGTGKRPTAQNTDAGK